MPAGDRTDRSAPLLEAEGLRVTAAQRKAWQAAGAARPLIGDAYYHIDWLMISCPVATCACSGRLTAPGDNSAAFAKLQGHRAWHHRGVPGQVFVPYKGTSCRGAGSGHPLELHICAIEIAGSGVM